jgi:precorrin-2 dehydrogenase/sirohydrochlorin ferrochelatase
MNYYPICLDVSKKRCVVIGGGQVAARKVERLLDCGADVVVVSRALAPELADWTAEGRIVHRESEYDAACLDGAFLVIGATDREDVNAAVSRDARARGLLVNIVDAPAHCNFILPSLHQQGDLVIAVSTGGKSPALARKMREEFARLYGWEYGVLVEILGELRERIMARGRPPDENKQRFDAVVGSDVLEAIRRRDAEAVRRLILRLTGEDLPVSFREGAEP